MIFQQRYGMQRLLSDTNQVTANAIINYLFDEEETF